MNNKTKLTVGAAVIAALLGTTRLMAQASNSNPKMILEFGSMRSLGPASDLAGFSGGAS